RPTARELVLVMDGKWIDERSAAEIGKVRHRKSIPPEVSETNQRVLFRQADWHGDGMTGLGRVNFKDLSIL
ncbi:hypothetical protein ACCS48_34590, partial [Rhizobium brockwellii]|uniref:hypothetical protein n=1 Tax=Rhizobium brockwellii TaxID=3019932 RepID=UPI003F944A9B